jgi:hypothetical protein
VPPDSTGDGFLLLGCLRTFDRHGLLGRDPEVIARTLSAENLKDARKLAQPHQRTRPSPVAADEPQFPRRSEPRHNAQEDVMLTESMM